MIENANSLFSLAVILVAGIVAGRLAHRIKLPHVTGQIIIGVIIGRSVLNIFSVEVVSHLEIVTDFALGFIALNVGEHLNIRNLKNAGRRLFLLLLTESIVTPAIVIAATYPLVKSLWLPLLLGTMAISTAPATVIALIKETRSKGVFVKTLSAAVALNNIACIVLFAVARAIDTAGLSTGGSIGGVLLAPVIQIGLSLALGAAAGFLLILATGREVVANRLAAMSMVALVLVAGLALHFGLSLLLSCLFLGVTLANFAPRQRTVGGSYFENIESVVFAAFFTLAGMEIEIQHVVEVGLLSLVVVAARFVGKYLAANLAMRLAGATRKIRQYLGLALMPQAGVAVGLILLIQADTVLEPLHHLVLEIGLTTVMVNELLGSLAVHFALKRSGEVGRDRPRLMDFIDEEHIVVDFQATDKTDAIVKLADIMIRSHKLSVNRDEFIQGILRREEEASTCLGFGLAVPHGILEEGTSMLGVMAVSRDGLAFDTPDGEPVHCMVLLATPDTERDRHLQVMAGIAGTLGRDSETRDQLFNAETAAHAHDVLHAEESEGFNYYLSE